MPKRKKHKRTFALDSPRDYLKHYYKTKGRSSALFCSETCDCLNHDKDWCELFGPITKRKRPIDCINNFRGF